MKLQELLYVFALIAIAILTQQCGGDMGSPPPAPDASDAAADALDCSPTRLLVLPGCEAPPLHCYAAGDPFKAFVCGAEGVSCACPTCFVVDAGEGTCEP